MIKKLLNRLLPKRESAKKHEALYKLVTHTESKESERILKQAGQLANEEQRKVYYGNTQKSEA